MMMAAMIICVAISVCRILCRGRKAASGAKIQSAPQPGGSVWDNYTWEALPLNFRLHFEVLGYNRMNWNEEPGATPAFSESLSWGELTNLQKTSAMSVGY